ncbi:MAG: C39 family peptidase [Armatimonadota bacterium]|nr:C39 family peptidase [bacterium]
MLHKRPLSTSVLLVLSLLFLTSVSDAQDPPAFFAFRIMGVERTKQLTNYCGPACLTSVLRFHGSKLTQEDIGKEVYEQANGATNGADMLLYARSMGYAAYSWNSGVDDVKKKISEGIPVIILQQNSASDTSGHYRVLTGYDDDADIFYVMDPYYDDITRMSYVQCRRLWEKMGYWALIVMPTDMDKFTVELGDHNPVVHMDLSYANLKKKQYKEALEEAKLALKLEPGNTYAQNMLNQIQTAIGAGKSKD